VSGKQRTARVRERVPNSNAKVNRTFPWVGRGVLTAPRAYKKLPKTQHAEAYMTPSKTLRVLECGVFTPLLDCVPLPSKKRTNSSAHRTLEKTAVEMRDLRQ
jgi:hypothetical protein